MVAPESPVRAFVGAAAPDLVSQVPEPEGGSAATKGLSGAPLIAAIVVPAVGGVVLLAAAAWLALRAARARSESHQLQRFVVARSDDEGGDAPPNPRSAADPSLGLPARVQPKHRDGASGSVEEQEALSPKIPEGLKAPESP